MGTSRQKSSTFSCGAGLTIANHTGRAGTTVPQEEVQAAAISFGFLICLNRWGRPYHKKEVQGIAPLQQPVPHLVTICCMFFRFVKLTIIL
ncbi:hypothetical protein [Scytonema sp. NUACC21]